MKFLTMAVLVAALLLVVVSVASAARPNPITEYGSTPNPITEYGKLGIRPNPITEYRLGKYRVF